MTRFARLLCIIYGAELVFLSWAAYQSALADSTWAVFAMAACSVIPLISWLREVEFADAKRAALADVERAARVRDRAEQRAIKEAADALRHVCCERWWTSLGTDHDPTCEKERRTA